MMPITTPIIFRKLDSLPTFQTLLNTLRTQIIIQMTIQTKVSMLRKPKSPEWAVSRMLSAAFIRMSIRFWSLMLAMRNASSLSEIPRLSVR